MLQRVWIQGGRRNWPSLRPTTLTPSLTSAFCMGLRGRGLRRGCPSLQCLAHRRARLDIGDEAVPSLCSWSPPSRCPPQCLSYSSPGSWFLPSFHFTSDITSEKPSPPAPCKVLQILFCLFCAVSAHLKMISMSLPSRTSALGEPEPLPVLLSISSVPRTVAGT